MELNRDVLSVLGTRLSPGTLESLRTVSKTYATDIQETKKTILFWKNKAEYLADMELPFEPVGNKVKYWKDIVNLLETADFTTLFRTGQYEFVYIGIKKRLAVAEDVVAAADATVKSDETAVLSLLFENYRTTMEPTIRKLLIRAAIHDSINVFQLLLDNSTREQVISDINNTMESIIFVVVERGITNMLSMIIEKYPLSKNEYDNLLLRIKYSSNNRDGLLRVFVNSYPGTYGSITVYCGPTPLSTKVSGTEMDILLNSGKFTIDVIPKVTILSPEAAYMLYTLSQRENDVPEEYKLDEDGMPSEYMEELINVIAPDAKLFEKALEYAQPADPYYLWPIALTSNEESWSVLIKYYELDKATAYAQIRKCITYSFSPQAVAGVCNHVGITIQDLEVIIAESNKTFIGDSVKNIIKLGVPLRRSPTDRFLVGEKLAFNCVPSCLDPLKAAGFDFDACGTDLMKHTIDSANMVMLRMLKNYVTEYDPSEIYAKASWEFVDMPGIIQEVADILGDFEYNKELYDKVPLFIESIKETDTRSIIRLLESGIPWESVFDYNNKDKCIWLSQVPQDIAKHPLMKRGIKIMKTTLKNTILRGYGHDNYDFLAWLMLARDLLSDVSYEGFNTINIDGNMIRIGNHLGKYKHLDMFSDAGIPLTTKNEIRERRNELQRL